MKEPDTTKRKAPDDYDENEEGSDSELSEEVKEDAATNKKVKMPKKSKYRMRAHINPLNRVNYPFPLTPSHVNWKLHYPLFYNGTNKDNENIYCNTTKHALTYSPIEESPLINGLSGKHVEVLDLGCGYGGLMTEIDPTVLTMGMEIRGKVVNYVAERINALRCKSDHKKFNNIAVLHTNSMKTITNYFRKGDIAKMFFCFPDPHFKRSNYRRRIIKYGNKQPELGV